MDFRSISRILFEKKPPDASVLAGLIREARNSNDLAECKRAQDRILETPHRNNGFLANLLVEMYGSCGGIKQAEWIFSQIVPPNVFSWNNMITAYARNGHPEDAWGAFLRVSTRDEFTSIAIIRTHIHSQQLPLAKHIFFRCTEWNAPLCNTLVQAFVSKGRVSEARCVLDSMLVRDAAASTSMIVAYGESGNVGEAERIFFRIHMHDVVSWTAILSVYAQNGCLLESKVLFEKIPQRNRFTWNALLQAFAACEDLESAKSSFNQMPERDPVSWNTIMGAFAQGGQVEQTKAIFEKMPQHNVICSTAIIVANSVPGHLEEAVEEFQKLPVKDVASCSRIRC